MVGCTEKPNMVRGSWLRHTALCWCSILKGTIRCAIFDHVGMARKKTRKNAVRRDHLSSESRSPFVVQKKTFAICSMYGIFTYVWDRMAVLFGQMLVNIPYLEHIGSVYKFAKNGELLWIARWGFKMFLDVLSMYFEPDLEWWYAINVHIWLWNNHSNTINNDQHHLSTKPSLRTWSCMRTYTCIIQIYCDDVCVCALYIHIISVCVYNYNI